MRNECSRRWLRPSAPVLSPPSPTETQACRSAEKKKKKQQTSFPLPAAPIHTAANSHPPAAPPARPSAHHRCSHNLTKRHRPICHPTRLYRGRGGKAEKGEKRLQLKRDCFFSFNFFLLKIKPCPSFRLAPSPSNLLSSGLSAKRSSPSRGLHFHIPSPGAKSCKDASQSQLYTLSHQLKSLGHY